MRVLLVEDDQLLRALTARILRSAGHQVTEAGDATEAGVALAAPGDAVDVLFTDITLNGSRDGIALAEQELARCPDLRVILTSGDPSHFPHSHAWASSVHFLPKPYRKQQLLQAVEGTPPAADPVA